MGVLDIAAFTRANSAYMRLSFAFLRLKLLHPLRVRDAHSAVVRYAEAYEDMMSMHRPVSVEEARRRWSHRKKVRPSSQIY
jgi:hypothetical protein